MTIFTFHTFCPESPISLIGIRSLTKKNLFYSIFLQHAIHHILFTKIPLKSILYFFFFLHLPKYQFEKSHHDFMSGVHLHSGLQGNRELFSGSCFSWVRPQFVAPWKVYSFCLLDAFFSTPFELVFVFGFEQPYHEFFFFIFILPQMLRFFFLIWWVIVSISSRNVLAIIS